MEKVISLLAPLSLGRPMDDLCRDLQRNARRPLDRLTLALGLTHTIGESLSSINGRKRGDRRRRPCASSSDKTREEEEEEEDGRRASRALESAVCQDARSRFALYIPTASPRRRDFGFSPSRGVPLGSLMNQDECGRVTVKSRRKSPSPGLFDAREEETGVYTNIEGEYLHFQNLVCVLSR